MNAAFDHSFRRGIFAAMAVTLATFHLSAVCAENNTDADGWRLAVPGWEYTFPRDHYSHSGFKTEWWYFTGNLRDPETRTEFGYQLTFFRQGIIPELAPGVTSRFALRDLPFAHFAVANLRAKSYRHAHRWNRGAFGEAGFSDGGSIAWIEDWRLDYRGDGDFALRAEEPGFSIDLRLRAKKTPVFHGKNGISQKAQGRGRASHYYSFTRLWTEGTLRWEDRTYSVQGWSWYDHEWATNQLTETQTGWDWFSLQFEDGTDLMLFQIRTTDGGIDPFSSGTWIGGDGTPQPIHRDDFILAPTAHWESPHTGGKYPVQWKLQIPGLDLDLEVAARLEAQEFRQPPISYWEGAVTARGTRAGSTVAGAGYLEMTGYAGPIVGMQAPGATE